MTCMQVPSIHQFAHKTIAYTPDLFPCPLFFALSLAVRELHSKLLHPAREGLALDVTNRNQNERQNCQCQHKHERPTMDQL